MIFWGCIFAKMIPASDMYMNELFMVNEAKIIYDAKVQP